MSGISKNGRLTLDKRPVEKLHRKSDLVWVMARNNDSLLPLILLSHGAPPTSLEMRVVMHHSSTCSSKAISTEPSRVSGRDSDGPLLDVHHSGQAFEIRVTGDYLCLLIPSCGIHNRISHGQSVLYAQIGSE